MGVGFLLCQKGEIIMIYLDNAATSFPKPSVVYDEVYRCMKYYCANPGRGGHAMSIACGKAVFETRELVSNFFNVNNPMQIIFTKNATEAINYALYGYLESGDHVITTHMEHNSVIRPLRTLERDKNISLTVVKGDLYGYITASDIEKCIQANTKLIVCTISSNVNGIIMPIREIGDLARKKGITFMVDGSQGAGSIKIDVQNMFIDILAFPGHKGLLGPQGVGGLYVRECIKLKPLMQGGTGSNSEMIYQPEMMPDLLESGTLNTPGIIGLKSGVEYINRIGVENISEMKYLLTKRLYEGLSEVKGIVLYSRLEANYNSGVIAANLTDIDSTEVSYELDKKYNIATRAGLHCAPLAHELLGTINSGIVRFSLGCFSTLEDIDFTVKAMKEISNKINKQ